MSQPATTTDSPPPAAEDVPSPPLSASASVKQESRDSTAMADQLPDQNDKPETQSSQQEEQPPSVAPATKPCVPMTELRSLSSALSSFQCCFDDLQNQLNTLKTAVDSLIASPPRGSFDIIVPTPRNSNIAVKSPRNSIQQSPPVVDTTVAPKGEILDEKSKKSGEDSTKTPSLLELEGLCQTMCGKSLKKYLVANLNEIDRLREEVPKALKLAPSPTKLVLECSGRFFLQGRKAYVKDSPMVAGREGSVLALECLLLMMGGEENVVVEKDVKEEADQAALLWRNRMLSEGGISGASEIDARGLLLLIACFGVPVTFKNDDLRDLIRASNAKEMPATFRKSSVLMAKVAELIEGMLKNRMEVEAVDLVYTFGLEDRFNPLTILTSFLKRSKELTKKAKRAGQASNHHLQNLANKKKIDVFKSVVKCLEGHKIDPSMLLPSWKLRENISTLEKFVAEFDENNGEERSQKRKVNGGEPSKNLKPQEMKRPRYTNNNSQGLLKPKVVGLLDGQRHLLENSMHSHRLSNYSAPSSVLYAPGTGQYAGAYGGTTAVDPAGYVTNHSVQSYGWRGDPALTERVVAHSYTNLPSSSSIINGSLYGASPSLEAYSMVPSGSSVGIAGGRGSGGDLYQFADVVVKNEYQPPVVPSHHHSSYLK